MPLSFPGLLSRFHCTLITNVRIKRHRRDIFYFIFYYNRRGKKHLKSTFHGAPYCNKILLALLQSVFWHLNNDTHVISTHRHLHPSKLINNSKENPFLNTETLRCTEECQCEGIWTPTELITLLLALFINTQAFMSHPTLLLWSLQTGSLAHWMCIQHWHGVELNKTGQYSLPDTSYCFGYSTEWKS